MEQRRFKVVEILALQSGTSERGEWRSQQVILEELQNVQFPDRYLVRFCGEKVAMLADLKKDDIVTASWTASVRSFPRFPCLGVGPAGDGEGQILMNN